MMFDKLFKKDKKNVKTTALSKKSSNFAKKMDI